MTFIPRTGLYHWVPFIFAAVLFTFAFFFRINRLPLSVTLFSLAITFLIAGLFMTPHRLHLLQLGNYLQTLFSFSFEIIPFIAAILCITGLIIPGSLWRQSAWLVLAVAYLVFLPPILISLFLVVISLLGVGFVPLLTLGFWFVLGSSTIAFYSQITSQL